ncbi:para-nitrobenzyl esterase-like isoform X6 [Maniola jurtina]|uniref:para-nitrobenzyl esterase-like isoform X6 n=1 Tax=Maniola jurtina TaxID=191418 RepID=UPI001E688C99|nr:para-nitrobenzyl esterase-like isoform X6 [Maniola jurtina]
MWLYVVACYLFAVVSYTVSEQTESRVVRIDSGPVRGYKDPNEDIFVYYGIPYAKAPSGPDRFKAPLPSPIWSETLEAVDTKIICPQVPVSIPGLDSTTKVMQEDCLIANVFVPNTDENNLPVVVYVHGGGFIIGYGNSIKPKKLATTKKIIVVTFNYRLAAHGFLCLGTEEVPGNAGIKDQVALLRWVKKNIASFGGNSDDVTISGNSAGSTSVDLLMISKMAKGLFSKVIPESGANLSPYSVQVDPIQNAKEYAKLLQYDGEDDIHNLQDFYKSISYELLQSGNVVHRTDSDFLMTPCVERDIGEERFLEDSPVNILKRGDFDKLPMLYGFTNMEGLMRIDVFDSWKNKMNTKFSDFLPPDLQFKSEKQKEAVADKIKMFYFGDEDVSDETVLDYVNYFTDVLFACPTLRSISLQIRAGNNQIYLYEYSYVDDSTPVVPYTNVRGASHIAQTISLLDGVNLISSLDERNISDDLRTMKYIMRDLWGNFIATGKPESSQVPAWPPVGEHWSPHMALKKNPELLGALSKERCLFWNRIFDKYYRAPLPPPPPSTRRNEL